MYTNIQINKIQQTDSEIAMGFHIYTKLFEMSEMLASPVLHSTDCFMEHSHSKSYRLVIVSSHMNYLNISILLVRQKIKDIRLNAH